MIEVFVISNQRVLVDGLRVMLEGDLHARFAGWAESLCGFAHGAPAGRGFVLLVDVENSLDLGQLRKLCTTSEVRVCLFTRTRSPELFFQAREAGVRGIISTTRPGAEVVDALVALGEGQFFFDPLLAGDNRSLAIHLTPREGHLIELLTQGLKNKEIAYQLGITEGTVKVYLSKLFQKVGAKDRFDLALSGLKNLGLASTSVGKEPAASSPTNANTLRTLVTRLAPVRERRSDSRALAG